MDESSSSMGHEEPQQEAPAHFGPNAPKKGRRFVTAVGGGWDRRTEAIEIASLREPRSRPTTASRSRSRSQSRPQTATRSRPSTAPLERFSSTNHDERIEYSAEDPAGRLLGNRPRSRHTIVDMANSRQIDHSYTKRYGPPLSSGMYTSERNAKLKTIYGGQPTPLVYMSTRGKGGKHFRYVSLKPAGTEERSVLHTIEPPAHFQQFDQWLEGIRRGLVEQLGPAIHKHPNLLKSRPSTGKTTKQRADWQNNMARMQNELLVRALAAEQDGDEVNEEDSPATTGPQA